MCLKFWKRKKKEPEDIFSRLLPPNAEKNVPKPVFDPPIVDEENNDDLIVPIIETAILTDLLFDNNSNDNSFDNSSDNSSDNSFDGFGGGDFGGGGAGSDF